MSDRLELFKALAAFQADVPEIPKNAVNPHFKSRYADLDSVCQTVRPLLQQHGLFFYQTFEGCDRGVVSLRQWLVHVKTGELLDFGTCAVPYEKQGPQAAGSAITYARRYGMTCALGLLTEDDDDGNRGHDRAGDSARAVQGAGRGKSTSDSAKLYEDFQRRLLTARDAEELDEVGREIRAAAKSITTADMTALTKVGKARREELNR